MMKQETKPYHKKRRSTDELKDPTNDLKHFKHVRSVAIQRILEFEVVGTNFDINHETTFSIDSSWKPRGYYSTCAVMCIIDYNLL